jgi:HK97 family phage portal protein
VSIVRDLINWLAEFDAPAVDERSVDLTKPDDWLLEYLGGGTASAGISVTQETALTHMGVFAAVRILAESLASLPLHLYQRAPDGSRGVAYQHALYPLLHSQPNGEMTAYNFRETLMGHLALHGNCYAEIEYDASGRAVALWPLNVEKMREIARDDQGRLVYVYELPDRFDNRLVSLPMERVMHVRGLGGNGLIGFSPLRLARNAIGLALVAENYGAKLFKNGAIPKVVLKHPGTLKKDAAQRLKSSWMEMHGGLENAHRVAVLEEGMDIETVGIPPEDAQFLQTRKFQLADIARMFRVPPHMLADLDRATFSNIEHQGIEFVQHTLRPWLVNWEQEISRSLLLSRERSTYYAEFAVDGLLRGDMQSRYTAYSIGRQNGWLSANDIRRYENLNPIPGGDVYLVPLNMVPADSLTAAQPTRHLPAAGENRARIERRAANTRHKLSVAQRQAFAADIARIIRRERSDIKAAAARLLPKREYSEFETWLSEFYESHATWAAEQMEPGMSSYANQVSALVEDEINAASDSEMLTQFVRAYARAFGTRTATRHYSWVKDRYERALAGDEDPQDAVGELLDGWVDTLPAGMAQEESNRENNAVAKHLYVLGGIQRIRSVAFGSENCPYCRNLDGVIVGITENFLSAGQEFEPEGADAPLTVDSDRGHAPYHRGCDCMNMAVLA